MNSKIGVFVRSRPLLNHEIRGKRCLTTSRDTVTIADKKIAFDSVFDESVDQNVIYEKCVKNLVEGCFQGFNGTVFAYGQTGSGKTHSIMGKGTDEEAGIIPRAIDHIFTILNDEKEGRIASVRVSMMEIYNDECKDLLHTEIPSRDIMIREDKDGRIFFTGAREEAVGDAQTAMAFLEQGNANRSTAETLMNQTSSRSHAIFTISIELLEYAQTSDGNNTGGGGSYIQAKLNLVDLAGSERAKRTGAVGTRLKESVGINQGLLSLGKVIRALTSTPIPHVPYRESKLTRFLQDSLGGNSQTVMLACISSAESNLHETLSTLQYASRAKTIQNRVVANISEGAELLNSELETSMVSALRTQMEQLQGKLDFYTSGAHAETRAGMPPLPPGHSHAPPDEVSANKPNATRIIRIVAQLQESLQITLDNIERSGASAASCGAAWQLVVVSREAVQIMQSISQSGSGGGITTNANRVSVSMSFRTLRSSVDASSSGGSSLPSSEQEIEALRAELAECHEDLKRDEDIFAEKIRDLKKAKKTIRDLETANHQLSNKQTEVQEQLLKLSTKGGAKTAFTYVPLNQEDKLELSFSGRAGVQSIDNNNNESEFDDLDLSIAVAASEPDISSLMEDLEAMAREKDDLLEHSRIAERKVESVAHTAQTQREEFARGQERLKQRMQELERSIRSKQDTISQLTESHSAAKEVADKQTQRAAQLEKDSETLRTQLTALDSQHVRSVEEAEEERRRRRLFEQKLTDAQTQLQEMERDRQKFIEAERRQHLSEEKSSAAESRRTEEHLHELETLRAEHARLSTLKDEAEGKQRQTVEHMTLQLSQHRKKAADSEAQVQLLEEKNAELHARLERLGKAKQPIATNFEGNNGDEALSGERLKNWLAVRINNINDAKIIASEISRLQDIIAGLQADRAEIVRDLDPLLKQRADYEMKLRKNIAKMLTKMNAAKDEFHALEAEKKALVKGGADSEEVAVLKQKIEGVLEAIGSWDENREECEARLLNGVLDEEALGRLMELQEELETVDAEIALSQASIAQERLHLNRNQVAAAAVATLTHNGVISGDGLSAPSSDREFLSLLLGELKQNLRETVSGGSDPHQLDSVMEQMLSVIVAEKFKVTLLDGEMKHSAQLLDDKQAECDELVRVNLRARNEAIRREEQARKESDDKIAFLLQQLRSAEARISQDSSLLPDRPRTSNSYLSLDRSGVNSIGLRNSHSANGQRARRPTDSQLLEQVRMDPGEANTEITRRWQAEKERREQLERRTSELSRQLRQIQQQQQQQHAD